MTIEQILARVRNKLDDNGTPPMWTDEELIDDFANNSINELCEECFLIEDTAVNAITITGVSNISFAAASKTITKATGGFLDAGFYVGNKITITGTTSNNATLNVTLVTDTIITVSNTLIDEVNTSAVITATTTICRIPVTAGVSTYSVSDRIVRIVAAKLEAGTLYPPLIVLYDNSLAFMEYNYPSWETQVASQSIYLLTASVGTNKVRLWPTPTVNDTLKLVVYRRPVLALTAADTVSSPEISEQYHRYLIDGIAWQAYSKQDADTEDTKKSEIHRQLWMKNIEDIKRKNLRKNYHMSTNTPLAGCM